MSEVPRVTRIGQEQLEAVAATVAASFADDPIWQWLYGLDTAVPLDMGIVLGRMLVSRLAPIDEIHQIDDCGAVALWSAPGDANDEANDLLREAQGAAYVKAFQDQMGARLERVGQLSTAMHSQRPEEPHWYLGILGADPGKQNQGLGGKVLLAMTERCDHYGLPIYLESSNPRNYGFYQRHGFVETETLTVADAPPLLGFWRTARG